MGMWGDIATLRVCAKFHCTLIYKGHFSPLKHTGFRAGEEEKLALAPPMEEENHSRYTSGFKVKMCTCVQGLCIF